MQPLKEQLFVTNRWFAPVFTCLCATGLLLSYLALEHYFKLMLGAQEGGSFCNINSAFNCDLVTKSAWSNWFGIPLGAFGLSLYSFLLLEFFLLLVNKNTTVASIKILRLVSLLSALGSVALFLISEFVIGSLCLMCIGIYLVNFCLCAATFFGFKNVNLTQPLFKFLLSAVRAGITAALLLFFFAGYFSQTLAERVQPKIEKTQISEVLKSWQMAPVQRVLSEESGDLMHDFSEGDLKAKIQVVEFADIQCGHCRDFYKLVKNVLRQFDGQYSLTFRNYPLDKSCNSKVTREMHRFACFSAEFARCAGEQGKFDQALDFLFDFSGFTESSESKEAIQEKLLELAPEQLGLDPEPIKECVVSGRHKPKIAADIKDAELLGIFATPAVWINGKVANARTEADLKLIFNQILGR